MKVFIIKKLLDIILASSISNSKIYLFKVILSLNTYKDQGL